jgi:hypothetical protein
MFLAWLLPCIPCAYTSSAVTALYAALLRLYLSVCLLASLMQSSVGQVA